LREIAPGNEAAVRALKVAPGQEQFFTSVPESLDEARRSPEAHPWFRAIYAAGRCRAPGSTSRMAVPMGRR
jgi:diamine N-acetyltransferase